MQNFERIDKYAYSGSKFRFARTYGRISYDAFNAPTEAVE